MRIYTTQKQQRVTTAINLDLDDRRAKFITPYGEKHRVLIKNIVWIIKTKKIVRICYNVTVDVSGSSLKSVKSAGLFNEARLQDNSVMLFNPRYHRIENA